MEPRFLTVAEAARYLRLNPRSVYLLAQRGGIPASRLTGKWLFPVHLLDEWIESSARGRTGAGDPPSAARGTLLPTANLLLAGSDDPALELLADALRDQAEKPSSSPRPSGAAGGSWRPCGKAGRTSPSAPTPPRPPGSPTSRDIARALPGRALVVVTVFGRELGLVVWTGNPRKLEGVRDLGRRGVRFVNRQPGSATRAFTEEALAEAQVEQGAVVGFRDEVSTHWAVGAPGPPRRGRRRGLDPGRGLGAEPRIRPPRPRALRPRRPQGDLLQAARSRPSSRPSARSGSGGSSSGSADTTGRARAAWSARWGSERVVPRAVRRRRVLVSFMWHRRPRPPNQPRQEAAPP